MSSLMVFIMACNGVAPKNVNNKVFTKALAKALKRPSLFRVPAVALKLILGELSIEVLRGQNVIPQALLDLGFKFKYPILKQP